MGACHASFQLLSRQTMHKVHQPDDSGVNQTHPSRVTGVLNLDLHQCDMRMNHDELRHLLTMEKQESLKQLVAIDKSGIAKRSEIVISNS